MACATPPVSICIRYAILFTFKVAEEEVMVVVEEDTADKADTIENLVLDIIVDHGNCSQKLHVAQRFFLFFALSVQCDRGLKI